jgi:hypothetical protein
MTLKDALAGARLEFKGWVDVAATTSPLTESSTRDVRSFTWQPEGIVLQQIYASLERTLPEGRCWALGGKAALLIGEDASLTHARGLLDDQSGDVQVDLYEAWISVRMPVAQGLTVKLGKFATPLGYEVTEAALNLLPSRSTTFGYGLPFTHVGALATLNLSPRASVSYGVVLGWDVWDDVNDALTQVASASWTSASGRDALVVGGSVGAEREDDDDDLRVVVDGTWTHTWSACFQSALNGHVGWEEGAAADGGEATWYAATAYLTWKQSERLSLPLRAEVFHDEDGTRVGQPATLLGLSLGADWKLWDGATTLRLRPEVRYDRSLDGPFYDEDGDEDQLSLTLDVVFSW